MSTTKRKIDANYDPYKILGIETTSTDKEIDKAYKKLALKWHPDKNADNLAEAQKRFVEIYKAYEFLKDKTQKTEFDELSAAKKKRAAYDNQRKAASSAKRQHFLDKLSEKEKAFEARQTSATSSKSNDDEILLRRLRKEGAQLLKRMAEERELAEKEARVREILRQQKEEEESTKANAHPHAHLYNMSLDDLSAFEDEVLGL